MRTKKSSKVFFYEPNWIYHRKAIEVRFIGEYGFIVNPFW